MKMSTKRSNGSNGSKVLIKLKFDLCDADYVYGIHVMNKDRWEKWKKIYSQMDNVGMFHCELDGEMSSKSFLKNAVKVTEITDKEYTVLNKLGLVGFGVRLPEAYYDGDLGKDIEGDELSPEPPNYEIEVWNKKTEESVNIEDKI